MCLNDVDVLLEIKHYLQDMPIEVVFKQVKRRSDDREDFVYENASQQVRKNIDMDDAAKKCVENDSLYCKLKNTRLLHQKASIDILNSTVMGEVNRQIRPYAHGRYLEEKLVTNGFKSDWLCFVEREAI